LESTQVSFVEQIEEKLDSKESFGSVLVRLAKSCARLHGCAAQIANLSEVQALQGQNVPSQR
jgi:hypothetical protein